MRHVIATRLVIAVGIVLVGVCALIAVVRN